MLFLCPTPIGNLDDITIRTLKTLEDVELIACEDTRVTQKLLNHYSIKTKTTSLHKYNMKAKIDSIIDLLRKGKDIAYVTDAGMPGISDPGRELVVKCQEEGIKYTVLPGPSAFTTALVLSGMDNQRFTYVGFLDDRANKRREQLEELKDKKETIIMYESPHRLAKTLEDILKILGNREISVIREISKIYEEVVRGNVDKIIGSDITKKGEIVIVIEGAPDKKIDIDVEEELMLMLDRGYSKKDSVKIVSEKYKLPRNEVYQLSLKL